MTAAELFQQLQDQQAQMQPLLNDYAGAPVYIREQINNAFKNNEPLIRERAQQEERAYNMPGELMSQYDTDYGSTIGGASGLSRLNSILGRLGGQFKNVDVASGLMDRQGQRIDTIVGDLMKQYGLMLDARQNQYNMTMPLYQSLLQQEEAEKQRQQQMQLAKMQRSGGSSSSGINFADVIKALTKQPQPNQSYVDTPGAIGTNKDGSAMFPSGAIGYNSDGSLMYGKSQSQPLTNQYSTPKSNQSRVNQSVPFPTGNPLLKGTNPLFSNTSKLLRK